MSLTHASFFSGAGGMDIGLERAGWQTVSFSEIEPYACAILAERWPDIPNLGDIAAVDDVPPARLWTGGFPCQDLSVAGKRGGIDASRSGLAWAFLDLVERHRPEAFILENVPGLLSSNAGRDFGRLLREVGDLGYGWAYRLLDAQFFGVPQRRRRVFVLALDLDRHPDPDSAGAVLAVGTRCGRDHPPRDKARSSTSKGTGHGVAASGATSTRTISAAFGHHGWTLGAQDVDGGLLQIVGPSSDAGRMRAADGMAGRMDARARVAYVKGKRAQTEQDDETWRSDEVTPTLNGFDVGDTRATTIVAATLNSGGNSGGFRTEPGEHLVAGRSGDEDELLPVGRDSNRYRAIGNGVAAPVAEWIGRRLADYLHGRGTDLRDVR